ncbi:unnamed protein product [Arabidopsis thaliana]|uniref:Uncharacterized protein n=1 Tax=Arabidopsis thaliana TaxID=3702 RepID=Q9FGS6_ARATH|nr:unnamed protein product [Arabidopsis thaliana]
MAFPKSLLFLLLVPLLCYFTLITNKVLPQTENPVKQKERLMNFRNRLILELREEVEMQRKRSLEVETRAEIAEKKVAELGSKLENVRNMVSLGSDIDGKLLGLNLNKTQISQKWIPSIKDVYVTLTIYLQPKIQYLTDKSIEVSRVMTIWKPHFEKIQVALEAYTENFSNFIPTLNAPIVPYFVKHATHALAKPHNLHLVAFEISNFGFQKFDIL